KLLHPKERLALPEARLLGLAGRRGERLRLSKRVERGPRRAGGEPRLAEDQGGLRDALVVGEALDEALEDAPSQPVQAVLERALAHEPEAVRLADGARARGRGEGGAHGEGDHERDAQDLDTPAHAVLHRTTARDGRPPHAFESARVRTGAALGRSASPCP